MSLGYKVIEDDGIKVMYVESRDVLDHSKQSEVGIQSVRRKLVTEAPADFWKNLWSYQKLYHELTEGSFPSFSTWNHAMWGDGGIDRKCWAGRAEWERFVKDGAYFQAIGGPAGKRNRPESMVSKYHDGPDVFNLAMRVSGDSCWRDSEDCPVFVFGSKNRRLKEYLDQISGNPKTRELLKRAGWSFSPRLRQGMKMKPSYPATCAQDMGFGFDKKWIVKNTHFVTELDPCGEWEIDPGILREKIDRLAWEKGACSEFDLAPLYWALTGEKEKALDLIEKKEDRWSSHYEFLIPMYRALGREKDAEVAFQEMLYKGHANLGRPGSEFSGSIDVVAASLKSEGIDKAIEVYRSECKKNHLVANQLAGERLSFDWAYRRVWPYNFDKARLLTEGVPCMHGLREVTIPSVDHQSIAPLRWCHADVGMIKNDKGQLEILFFE